MSLTQSQIEKKLSNENLDELLDLWRTEQGAESARRRFRSEFRTRLVGG
jgi:hypothetical protein